MVVEALQIEYTREEYEIYKKWTKDKRARQLGFLFALFKIKNNNHVQCVVSGEFGQGKSSTAITLANWETIYVKRLLKWYREKGMLGEIQNKLSLAEESIKGINFGVKQNIIISPEDPASKHIYQPDKLNSYLIDDGYFFTTTGEANTTQTRRITKSITGNRKANPSMYWIFPNIFKIPTAILETMDIWVHKESLKVGDVLIPSRVIQLKEKFAREKIEKYARYPKAFKYLIRKHPSFITKIKFPEVRGVGWKKYLDKYDKYKFTSDGEEKEKTNKRIEFFKQLERVLEKSIKVTSTAKAREELIHNLIANAIKKTSKNEAQANQIATSFTDQFIKWQEEKLADQLTKDISQSLLSNTELEIKEGVEPAKEYEEISDAA